MLIISAISWLMLMDEEDEHTICHAWGEKWKRYLASEKYCYGIDYVLIYYIMEMRIDYPIIAFTKALPKIYGTASKISMNLVWRFINY